MTPEQTETMRLWREAYERTQEAYRELGYAIATYGGRSKQARAAKRAVVTARTAEKAALAVQAAAFRLRRESA